MSIVISNISSSYSRNGWQQYEVKLNNIPLVRFEHHSEDGMVECIKLAAEAIKDINIDDKISEYNMANIYKMLRAYQNE